MTQLSEEIDELTASPQKGLNFRPLSRVIQRKALLIVGVTGIASVASAALISRTQPPPVFAGNFQILVEPVSSEAKFAQPATLTRTSGAPNDNLFSLDYPTQLQILQSPGMLSDIVEQVQNRYPNFSLNDLRKNLAVARIGKGRFDQTKVIDIQYQGSNPGLVQFVLEKTAQKYLKYSLEERTTRISEGVQFIDEQLPDLEGRVNEDQTQLQQLQQQYELINPQARGEQLYGQIRELEVQQLGTQRELRELQALYLRLQEQLQFTPEEALVASALSENPYRNSLLEQLKEIESQIAIESATFTSASPEMQLLEERRQNLLTLLDRETQEILSANSSSSAENLSVFSFQTSLRQGQIQQLVETANQIQLLQVRLGALNEARTGFERDAQEIPEVTRQYAEIQQRLELTNQTLNQLLAQREKLRVEAAQDNFPWEVISPPQIPLDADGQPVPLPYDSKKKLLAGVMGGLLLGAAAAVVAEKIRDIFYAIEDFEDEVEQPILGVIPPQDTDEFRIPISSSFPQPGISGTIPSDDGNLSQFQDAFDTLYANIRFLYAERSIGSLAIASVEPGDGKSTVALNLALAVANMGQRVLLVDANLREPVLHTRLKISNRKGLSDLLTDKLVPNSLVEQLPLADNLFVLTAGKPSPKSIKLLGSAQMQHIVEEFQATFDFVIYDTPATDRFMDAIFLAAHLDGLLTVVGLAKTRKSLVLQTLEQLSAFRLQNLGIVIDRVKPQSSKTVPDFYGGSVESGSILRLDDFQHERQDEDESASLQRREF